MIKQWLIILFLIVSVGISAQNPKRFYKNGIKALETNQYNEAIDQFSNAISADSSYIEAYISRANTYKTINNLELAVKDFDKITKLNPSTAEYFFEAGKIHYQIKNYEKSLYYLSNAVILDNNYFQAYQYKSFSHIKLGEYNNGIVAINRALNINTTYVGYYVRGVAYDSLQNHQQAIVNYNNAIKLKPKFKKAYFALTKAYISNNQLDKALESANNTVNKFVNNADAYEIRSLVYYKMNRLLNAINDLSKLQTLTTDHSKVLFTRGMYYFEYNLFQNAKSDFTQVIAMSRNNYEAIYWRGRANEEIMENKDATKDYRNFLALTKNDSTYSSANITDAKKRIYEIDREKDAPLITITTPNIIDNTKLAVTVNSQYIYIEGIINDDSPINYLTINSDTIAILRNNYFNHSINIADISKVEMVVSDIYNNISTLEYGLSFIENNIPIVKILTPYANDNNEIYINADNSNLLIQGIIEDESLIKDIYIGDERAAFDNTILNPQFSTIIDIENKNTIVVEVIDEFDNASITTYKIIKQGVLASEQNPMGKTWVVFIENSDYDIITSLEGPSKDVSTMKSALANYDIHSFIHKKNMTKIEMERFFSIELRDLVKTSGVNSILIWYAGHGKFIDKTGYWIPTDGNYDDEFTYFNINQLKASMQSYSSYLTHTLVVTDACESGPAFYMAMRSTNSERLCSDATASKFRSAQVLTSAGNELAADNSQFTRVFAKTLQYNDNICIPIETIALKVIKAVSDNGVQKPLFGKISGFDDEDGTFFFIKKQ